MTDNTKKLIGYLKHDIKDIDAKLAEFQEDFTKDPAYALTWSDQTFTNAARKRVYSTVLDALTAPKSKATLASVKEHLQKQLMNDAKYPSKSTSAAHNLMHQAEVSAIATVLEHIEVYL